MKKIDFYKKLGLNTEHEIFSYLIDNLKDTIRTYDFFVEWKKVIGHISSIEISLNIMNSLIGKSDIDMRFKELIKKYPEVVSVIPILIACRDKRINISDIDGDLCYNFSKKDSYSDKEIEAIVLFSRECGLLKMLENENIKNLVDYCFGVEVGLDTNARKNRSGTAMENLIEVHIKSICDNNGFDYLSQASRKSIKERFDLDVPVDRSDRQYDFAIKANKEIYLVEVNYYGGGGSKLKAVAGEFKSLFDLIKTEEHIHFIWLTDGKGWQTAKRPLGETFEHTDYIANIKLIEDGLLEDIIAKGL